MKRRPIRAQPMTNGTKDHLTRASLMAGVATPVIYFGAQAAAAPFFPEFSALKHSASVLGSNLSSMPALLNVGAMLTGAASIVAAFGMFRELRRCGVWTFVALLLAACNVSFGLASIWAGAHPLPDPEHNPGLLGAGMFAAPFVAFIAALGLQNVPVLKSYLAINALGFGVVAAIYSGVLPVDMEQYSGAVQKLGALVMMMPTAVLCLWLLRNRD